MRHKVVVRLPNQSGHRRSWLREPYVLIAVLIAVLISALIIGAINDCRGATNGCYERPDTMVRRKPPEKPNDVQKKQKGTPVAA